MDRFEEALQLDPAKEDLGRILFYIGTCLKEMERFDEAIDVLERAVRADPEDILNHNLLGFCYYKIKRHEEAVACFRRAVELDPRSAIDWASLGSNLRDLGRIDEAIEMYEKALSLDPTIGFARSNLIELTERRSRG
jgi:ribosomal protein S12 methylthiotransferase accessory factor